MRWVKNIKISSRLEPIKPQFSAGPVLDKLEDNSVFELNPIFSILYIFNI